jgi:hypothetical protein
MSLLLTKLPRITGDRIEVSFVRHRDRLVYRLDQHESRISGLSGPLRRTYSGETVTAVP